MENKNNKNGRKPKNKTSIISGKKGTDREARSAPTRNKREKYVNRGGYHGDWDIKGPQGRETGVPHGRHRNEPRPMKPQNGFAATFVLVLLLILFLALIKGYTKGGSDTHQRTDETIDTNIASTQAMEVHFLDVGQGDATLIQCGDECMLIDAGENNQGTRIQAYLQKMGVEKLEYLVLTHTDSDHIGGADVIISKFDVETVFLSDFKKNNSTYDDLMLALKHKKIAHVLPELGSNYTLGDASITFIAPNDSYDTPNDSSIALVVEHGENSFLFTGDCEEKAENDILEAGYDVDCDVFKLGHHGSSTSNSEEFLNAITPKYAVISCEEGNSYGHPHAEPLNRLRSMGVLLFRTDEQGTVIAYSDGEKLTWNCAPSDTWQVGERTK